MKHMNETQIATLAAAIRLLGEEKRAGFWLSRADTVKPCPDAERLLADELAQKLTAEELEMSAETFGCVCWHDVAEMLLANPFEDMKQDNQAAETIQQSDKGDSE